ncbi:hypothetical protein LMIY3S_04011 [Labrys miyagiensis]
MRIADIMTRKVISVRPEATIGEAVDLMVNSRLSGLPVVGEDGTLVGVVTEGDFLRRPELGTNAPRAGWLSGLFRAGHFAEAYARTHGRHVSEIMTSDVVSIDEHARIEEGASLMEKHDIKRLPVLRDNKLVGIVSRADFVRALAGFVREPYEEQPVRDTAIKTAIMAELKAEPWAPVGTIDVVVKDGVVELNGVITDERQRKAVRVIAENTPGVQSVRDNMSWIEPMTGIVISTSERTN